MHLPNHRFPSAAWGLRGDQYGGEKCGGGISSPFSDCDLEGTDTHRSEVASKLLSRSFHVHKSLYLASWSEYSMVFPQNNVQQLAKRVRDRKRNNHEKQYQVLGIVPHCKAVLRTHWLRDNFTCTDNRPNPTDQLKKATWSPCLFFNAFYQCLQSVQSEFNARQKKQYLELRYNQIQQIQRTLCEHSHFPQNSQDLWSSWISRPNPIYFWQHASGFAMGAHCEDIHTLWQ